MMSKMQHQDFFRSPFTLPIPKDLPCIHCQRSLVCKDPNTEYHTKVFYCTDCNPNFQDRLRYHFFVNSISLIPTAIYIGTVLNDQTPLIYLRKHSIVILTDSLRLELPRIDFPLDSYPAALQKLQLYLTFA